MVHNKSNNYHQYKFSTRSMRSQGGKGPGPEIDQCGFIWQNTMVEPHDSHLSGVRVIYSLFTWLHPDELIRNDETQFFARSLTDHEWLFPHLLNTDKYFQINYQYMW